MALSPRALLRFGEMYRQRGVQDGRRVLPEAWIEDSWIARARSPFSGDDYGYGWFLRAVGGRQAAYARGFGGQLVVVVPSLAMTVASTSNQTTRTRVDASGDAPWSLIGEGLVPAAERAADGGNRAGGRPPPERDPGRATTEQETKCTHE